MSLGGVWGPFYCGMHRYSRVPGVRTILAVLWAAYYLLLCSHLAAPLLERPGGPPYVFCGQWTHKKAIFMHPRGLLELFVYRGLTVDSGDAGWCTIRFPTRIHNCKNIRNSALMGRIMAHIILGYFPTEVCMAFRAYEVYFYQIPL